VSGMSFNEVLAATIVRWGGLLALAVVMGGFALDLFVLPPSARELGAARRRLRAWGTLAVVILIVTTAAALAMRTRTMVGGDFAGLLAALPIVLTRTHFGAIWMGRTVALGFLLIVSPIPRRPLRVVGLLLSLGVALTTSLTGHAADWGDRSFAVLVDWIHAVTAAMWVGGLFGLTLAVFGDRAHWPIALLVQTARRFSRLAGYCLLAVVATGVYNVWIQVPVLSALWTTTYGGALMAKLGLAVALAAIGCANRYVVLPALSGDRPRRTARWIRLGRLAIFGPHRGPVPASARLARFVTVEALIAVALLGCTAVLGESTPKPHAGHVSPDVDVEGAPFRVRMDELHASGGVPRGWALTLPPGNAARGRAVFARLECFICHLVSGEGFPRPSKPGPSLIGVGGHHPVGYLLESILNPNAVIVEAPGYTGPDGRSTMPDYRESLSTSDLVDLVAYLKSLGG
jgi:copper resistance protein D